MEARRADLKPIAKGEALGFQVSEKSEKSVINKIRTLFWLRILLIILMYMPCAMRSAWGLKILFKGQSSGTHMERWTRAASNIL